MASRATVAVVVPCYNSEKTLARALDSVFAQTRAADEVHVVENGSSDRTKNLLEGYKAKHPEKLRIHALEKNVGPSAARNIGWNKAQTDYVAFLDSDDSWHPEKLSVQMNYLEKNPDVSICGHDHEGPGDRFQRDLPANFGVSRFSAKSFLWRNPMITPSVIVRRSIPLRFPEDRTRMEDQWLWFQISHAYGPTHFLHVKIAQIHKPILGFSGLSGSLWGMRRGELQNFADLKQEGKISNLDWLLLSLYSLSKHAFRVLTIPLRRLSQPFGN